MPTPTFLLGGGWDDDTARGHYREFLNAAPAARPTVACVVLDEGDGEEQFARFARVLRAAGPCEPRPVLVPVGGRLDVGRLGAADALLVCGGLSPGYAAALAPVGVGLRRWLEAADRPYAGFSAGAAVAARRALVGGWRSAGVQVCPQDAAEDLAELTVLPGLDLVPVTVEVHCAQWGTLPRLVAAVAEGRVPAGVALDEGTMLRWEKGIGAVSGRGHAWSVRPGEDGVVVRPLPAGGRVELPGA